MIDGKPNLKEPWQEDWRVKREGSETYVLGPFGRTIFKIEGTEADAKLAAHAPAMARVLLELLNAILDDHTVAEDKARSILRDAGIRT